MQLLILITIITWSFGGGYQNAPSFEIVGSPEQAAISIYNDRPKTLQIEPDHKEYKLFRVDLETKKITEVTIPKMIFQKGGS